MTAKRNMQQTVPQYNRSEFAPYFKRMRIHLRRAWVMDLVVGIISLYLVVLIYSQEKSGIAPLFLAGGLAGLFLPFIKPGRPSLMGARFNIPKTYSEYELKLESVIIRFRNKPLMILAPAPYFVWLLYVLTSLPLTVATDINTVLGCLLMSWLFVISTVSAMQYISVWWACGHEKKATS